LGCGADAAGFGAAAAGAGAAGFGGATGLTIAAVTEAALLVLREVVALLGLGPTVLPALAGAAMEVLQYLGMTAMAKISLASRGSTVAGALQWAFALAALHRFLPALMA
jgi:hypothetical protein